MRRRTYDPTNGNEPVPPYAPDQELQDWLASNAAETAQNVSTNSAKLALTGIKAGHIVQIIGEANRLEIYTGGSISSNYSWIVLKNSVELSILDSFGSSNDCDLVVDGNGWTLVNGSSTYIGWVNQDAIFYLEDNSASTLLPIGGATTWTDVTLDFWQVEFPYNQASVIPVRAMDYLIPTGDNVIPNTDCFYESCNSWKLNPRRASIARKC